MIRNHSHFQNKEPFFESFLRQLRFRKIINLIHGNAKVLDLGCGYNGELLKKIKHKISLGYGTDISVNPNFKENKISLIEHDLDRPLPFSSNEFDFVTSLANLEHLRDPERALQEIHRVLKPNGILLLTAPTTYSKPILEFLAYKLRLISKTEIRDHKHYFNREILKNYCRKIGFSSCKHKYFQLGMNNFLFARK